MVKSHILSVCILLSRSSGYRHKFECSKDYYQNTDSIEIINRVIRSVYISKKKANNRIILPFNNAIDMPQAKLVCLVEVFSFRILSHYYSSLAYSTKSFLCTSVIQMLTTHIQYFRFVYSLDLEATDTKHRGNSGEIRTRPLFLILQTNQTKQTKAGMAFT